MKTLFILVLLLSIESFADSLQFSMFGITLHGNTPTTKSANQMNNKITSDGSFVLNPQLNFTKTKENGTLLNASLVLDCYSNPAIFIGSGHKYKVDNDLILGWVVGVYARYYPDNENLELGRNGVYQILPMPALLLEYKITEKTSIRVNSNYLITFTDLAWEF